MNYEIPCERFLIASQNSVYNIVGEADSDQLESLQMPPDLSRGERFTRILSETPRDKMSDIRRVSHEFFLAIRQLADKILKKAPQSEFRNS